MARAIAIVFAYIVIGSWICVSSASSQDSKSTASNGVDAYFSPRGGCTKAVVDEIDKAKTTIHVQAYSFTSVPIAEAILRAKERGVQVNAILDKSNQTDKYSAATMLENHDIPVLIDAQHAIAHNKIIIIDKSVLLTGSFNFTKAAEESNAENLLIIRGNDELVHKYLDNFTTHRDHAKRYEKIEKEQSKKSKR